MPSRRGLPESQFHLLFLWMFPWSWHSPHQSLEYLGIQPEISKRKRKELRIYLGLFMGPPGGVACHGAARSRETASFSDPGSSSSCAQVFDLIRGHFRKMSNRSKSVHHHGPGNCHFKTQYQPAGRDNRRTPSDGCRETEKCRTCSGQQQQVKALSGTGPG